jgi:hypothetical protein
MESPGKVMHIKHALGDTTERVRNRSATCTKREHDAKPLVYNTVNNLVYNIHLLQRRVKRTAS